ncbi:ImmA/IrrE family metallo-endopeptidase [Paenibacillus lautus]|uniref:ImmA/IrrE family metallo-endopeptidase n=1 Tax=Paenibacillus lautus TaxID=1401 RepID=UPI001C7D5781|nr:ImmA/IrrE family metallo-endopeptidase [Paenibacillus lautus]MBX4145934.1 ImmA/IrrE family metallo-endopeptidase [Paenibacillus lautus]
MDLPRLHASKLIQRLGSNDPFELCKAKNITVVYEDLGNIYGYFYKANRISSIHINNRLNEFLARFTCGHELGHNELHPKMNLPFLRQSTLFSISRYEREANHFAVHLLIGENMPFSDETIKHFLLRCGIPQEFHCFYT